MRIASASVDVTRARLPQELGPVDVDLLAGRSPSSWRLSDTAGLRERSEAGRYSLLPATVILRIGYRAVIAVAVGLALGLVLPPLRVRVPVLARRRVLRPHVFRGAPALLMLLVDLRTLPGLLTSRLIRALTGFGLRTLVSPLLADLRVVPVLSTVPRPPLLRKRRLRRRRVDRSHAPVRPAGNRQLPTVGAL